MNNLENVIIVLVDKDFVILCEEEEYDEDYMGYPMYYLATSAMKEFMADAAVNVRDAITRWCTPTYEYYS